MKKILIIGNSGSGKSWLSSQLSQKLKLPEINLDSIVWEPGGFSEKRTEEVVEKEIEKIRSQSHWVVEGVFGSLAERLVSEADILLFLDLDWVVCEESLYLRGSESSKQLDPLLAEESFAKLLKWASEYKNRESKSSWAFHHKLFQEFSGKKVRFSARSQVNSFVVETAC
ncbi:AAA family ATPase [Vibrio metoecus]|uniref:AAA family ATPase n=1 Tax=Vibrio metoecus TaxID=1481663 RepID=UPI00300C4C6A